MIQSLPHSEYLYWSTNPPSAWDVLAYLKTTSARESVDAYNVATDAYLKELEGIVDDEDRWGAKHRKKARSLLKSYRQVCKPPKADTRRRSGVTGAYSDLDHSTRSPVVLAI